MKRFTALLISFLILILCACTANAENNGVAVQEDWQYTVRDNHAVVTKYTGEASDVSVPERLGNYPVTEIGAGAFYHCGIERITVSQGVKKIGWWAFYGCKSLKNVTLCNGLNTIEYGAFMNCQSLRQIELPSTVLKIGEDAFAVSCTTTLGIHDQISGNEVSHQNYQYDESFIVRGYVGTVAEQYAQDYSLCFSDLGKISFADVNLDGVIDNNDIILLKNYIENKDTLTELQKLSADVDGNAVADNTDMRLISQYVNGQLSYYALPAAAFAKPESNSLFGKRLYCDGDSVAKGTGTNILGSDFYSYCNYISDKYNMSMTQKAVPGTTLAKRKEFNNSILERIQKMSGDYDVILLDGGFNDLFKGVKVGSMTAPDDKSGNYDEYTMAGALESICYFLNSNYKDAIKLYVLCHNRVESTEQPLYWDTIKNILVKWEIPYVDLCDETDFNNEIDEISNQYFSYKSSMGKGDGVHPLAYAHEKIYGKLVEEKLCGLADEGLSVAFSKKSIDICRAEEFTQLPDFAGYSYGESLKWTSSSPEVAGVTDGRVTGKQLGTAVIRAETEDGKIASYVVNVKNHPLCLYLNKTEATLKPHQQLQLFAEFFEGTTSHNNRFSSSDDSVARVSRGGTVIAEGSGEATVTCTTSNGVKETCRIFVG